MPRSSTEDTSSTLQGRVSAPLSPRRLEICAGCRVWSYGFRVAPALVRCQRLLEGEGRCSGWTQRWGVVGRRFTRCVVRLAGRLDR